METFQVHARDLDVPVTGGGARLESIYANERRHLPLKRKYRPVRAKAAQWGVGGDHTGKKQVKVARRSSLGPVVQKVLVVGPTGKRSFQVA